jgi:hypothetical protein
MIEAVENHMPQVVVIDEIGTEAECSAARTIAQVRACRGGARHAARDAPVWAGSWQEAAGMQVRCVHAYVGASLMPCLPPCLPPVPAAWRAAGGDCAWQ